MRTPALLLLAAGLVAGCAAGSTSAPDLARGPVAAPGAGRGQAVAEMRCAGCHAIGVAADSPRADAPTFQTIRLRFNPLSWERVMADIGAGGHGDMPAVALDPADVRDVRAYIETLR